MTTLKIDFVSDVACPWCVIGLKALDQALARVGPEIRATLHFQPFELNPTMGPEGQDITEYITEKYGLSVAQAEANRAAIREREQFYQERGIRSVPAVIINDQHLISGGQPVETFERALRQIAD